MKILINNQQNYRQLDKTKIKKAAQKILSLLEQSTVELSILFVDNKKMQQLNATFRGIDKPTDVLSFPQIECRVQSSEFGDKNKTRNSKLETRNYILGDVVINIQMVASRAETSNTDFYGEVYRLLIHGVLHLLGYDHKKSRYKAMSMMKKEKEILDAIKEMG